MQYFDKERFLDRLKEWSDRLIKPRRFVGLALEDDAILAADLRREKGGFVVSGVKQFPFPEGIGLKDPERLGKALGEFLRENRFSGRKAVIGIPAKWLMVRDKVIPGTSRESIPGIIRILAEREFSLATEELALDYTVLAPDDKTSRIFLLAMLKSNLDRAILTVRWAGMDVLSVTVSSIAVFSMLRAGMFAPVSRYFLYLRKDYAEFVARDGEQTVDVRYIRNDMKRETGALITELRRIISGYSNSHPKAGGEDLLIWNGSSDPMREELKALTETLSPKVRITECNGRSFPDWFSLSGREEADGFIAPLMLVRRFNNADRFYIDFLHSHMDVRGSIIKRNQVAWASAVAAFVAVVFLGLFFIWRGENRDTALLRERLDGMKGDVGITKDIIQKVNMSGGWYTERPKILDCLKALTEVFPEEGTIWVTNLALTEKMEGVISGRASNEKSVIDVLDQMKGDSHFYGVQMIYLQNKGNNYQEVSFSMNFSYQDKELN